MSTFTISIQDFSGQRVGRYLLSSLIGCGAAGSVYRAIDLALHDLPHLAIKCVRASPDTRRRRRQIAEIDNHDRVACCPHVMMLYDFFEDVFDDEKYFFLVFPLYEMDMFKAIWKEKVYWRNDALIKEVFVQILDGVFACHRKGVFHRDLKPENIMCNAEGRDAKIGDFGLSSNRRLCRDGGCGTAYYMSPECLDGEEIFYYGDPADIWSLGVILFNMVTCRYPWKEARLSDRGYKAYMMDEDHLLCTSPISEPLSALLDRMWHPIGLRRLPIPAIREAVLEMESFYRPRRTTMVQATSPLSKEVASVVIDSEQTCVAVGVDEKKKYSCTLSDALDEVALGQLNLMD